jgi:hypothetical protein
VRTSIINGGALHDKRLDCSVTIIGDDARFTVLENQAASSVRKGLCLIIIR